MTLIYICYRLAKHPEQLQKLQAELDTLAVVDDLKALQSLPHLNGIINETLRLHPAVPTGGLREAPAEGCTVSGRHIPGKTIICAPRYTIGRRKHKDSQHHNTAVVLTQYSVESCFEAAEDFVPERWYSRPSMIKNKNAFAPFAGGMFLPLGPHRPTLMPLQDDTTASARILHIPNYVS